MPKVTRLYNDLGIEISPMPAKNEVPFHDARETESRHSFSKPKYPMN